MLDGVCTPTNVVKMDGVRIVGERINPTGKPVLKKAIMENDYSPLVKEAIDQVESGAHILDINVGVPSVDEALAMAEAVRLIQSVVDAPVQIDSANPSAIEAGLRICNGKAIVNSVNGMDCTLDRILPIVRKYGAAVIGLTMDENGIPDSALKRLRIAEKIQRKVLEYGIKKEDLYIDCLVLTAASEQRSVLQTLETVRLVKEQLGLKTVLGVSNVSFGFPDRALINKVFLAACLREGLDMAIMDPTDSGMTETVLASNLLWNHDRGGLEYIRTRHLQPERAIENEFHSMGVADLQSAILRGSKEEVRFATAYLLKQKEPLRIVDEYLIPALDRVGKLYEEQKIFLPQLIRCAEAAQLSFAEFPSTFNLSVSECRDRRKIVLATVKGDIHDIGKNLVKVLLESYQFDVIDLGKDVKPESILRAAIERKAQMVGLSSLMTTTINNMGETVQLLKQNLPGVYIMVGGAVLDEHCAREMGADAYGNDAQAAVRIAKEYFRVMGKNE